jgi:hypothetical protein
VRVVEFSKAELAVLVGVFVIAAMLVAIGLFYLFH